MTPEEEAKLSPEGRAELEKIRSVRGYTLPVHQYLARLDPEMLKRYGDLASYTLFGDAEGRPMDLKTRFLVLVGVTTACKGDREGVEWAAVRAIQNGATWNEVYEAAFMAALPAGIPAFEASCRAFDAMKAGDTWVDIEVPEDDAGT
ncbi:MAG: alkylhydroperoxidase/carboxymuconolactone decarboxylase family protein YurZ [Granulosicoccus sp.]|jgi:alkylhydroperoxidase/carboxymuconolactone decarboxylase family protein YurZ